MWVVTWFAKSVIGNELFPFDFWNFMTDCLFTSLGIILFFLFQFAIFLLIANEERKVVLERQFSQSTAN